MDDLGVDAVIAPATIGGYCLAACIAAAAGSPFATVPSGVLSSGGKEELAGFRVLGRKGDESKMLAFM